VSEERGAGFGSFLLGLGIGAVVGFLFAPEGEATRGKLGRHLRGLRDLAAEKAEELGDLLQGADDEADAPSARAALEQRLTEAKRRRRGAKALPARVERAAEEDEPVA
jgi:gas vesicle protein